MMVLCRLATKLKSVKKLFQGKRYTFVLLVGSVVPDIEKRKFEYLSVRIHNDLKSVLSKELVKKVHILNPNEFIEKYFSGSH